jgi:alkylation response protein AidB-like acyl-CoA dehydrogenase
MPKEIGGAGADHRAYVIINEEIARKSGVASIYISSPNSLVGTPIYLTAHRPKEKYLKPMITREKFFAFGLTDRVPAAMRVPWQQRRFPMAITTS